MKRKVHKELSDKKMEMLSGNKNVQRSLWKSEDFVS